MRRVESGEVPVRSNRGRVRALRDVSYGFAGPLGQVGGLLMVALALAGCTDQGALLFVDLQTDLVPGAEFAFVDVTLEPHPGGSEIADELFGADRTQDFVDGARVADFNDVPSGRYLLTVGLRRLDGEIAVERIVDIEIEGNRAVTVVATRSCQNVVCSDNETCSNGECVPRQCTVETPDACTDSGCDACPAPTAACAESRCVAGACFLVERADSMCGPDQFCQPETMCVDFPDLPDAGLDAGADAGADAGVDAGQADAGLTPPSDPPLHVRPVRGAFLGRFSLATTPELGPSDTRPKFSWTAVGDSYHLQVSSTRDFSDIVLDVDGLIGTSHTEMPAPAGTELSPGRYFWRVEACNDAGCSGFLPDEDLPYFWAGRVREDVDGTDFGIGNVIVGAPISGRDGGFGTLHRGEITTWRYSTGTGTFGAMPVGIAETSEVAESELGAAIAVGDFNGSGQHDLVGGAPAAVGRQGTTMVFRGGADSAPTVGPARSFNFAAPAPAGTGVGEYGASVAVADFDGDGFDDLVVGRPGPSSGTEVGRAVIYWGASSTPMLDEARTTLLSSPDGTGDFFGQVVAVIGDVNADGYVDLAIGAPEATTPGLGAHGRVHVYEGGPDAQTSIGSTRYPIEAFAPQVGDRFGAAIAGVGDIDHDSFVDVLVGAPGRDGDAGSVHVFYGGDENVGPMTGRLASDVPREIDAPFTPVSGAEWGATLSGGGDVDGDGWPDFAIAAPGFGNGVAYVFRPQDGTTRTTGFPPSGDSLVPSHDDFEMRFGTCLALTVDRTGDGHADIVVGAPEGLARPEAEQRGFVNVFVGQPGDVPASALTIEGVARAGSTYLFQFGQACR